MSTNAYHKSLRFILFTALILGSAGYIGSAYAQESDRAIDRFRNNNRPAYRLYKGKMNEELDRAKLNLPQTKKKMELKSDPFAGTVSGKGVAPDGDFIPIDDLPQKLKKPEPLIKSADWRGEEDNRSALEDPRFDEEQEEMDETKEKIFDFNNLPNELMEDELGGVTVEDGNVEINPETQAELAERMLEEDQNLDPEMENGFSPDGRAQDEEEDENGFKPALSGTLSGEQTFGDTLASGLSDAELEAMADQANEQPLGAVVKDNSLVVGERPDSEQDKEDDVYLNRSKEVMDALVQPHKEARDKRYDRHSGFDQLVNRYGDKHKSLTDRYKPGRKLEDDQASSAVVSVSAAERVQESRMGLLRDSNQFNPGSQARSGFEPASSFKPTSDVDFGGQSMPAGLAGFGRSGDKDFNGGNAFGGLNGAFNTPGGLSGLREPSTPGILKIPGGLANAPGQPKLPKFGQGIGNPSAVPNPTPSFRETRREGLRIQSSMGGDRPSFPLGNRGF